MNVVPLRIEEVIRVEPRRFGDERGFFLETYQQARYIEAGISQPFVQDNMSRSSKGVLRGLHLQNPNGQGKLVSVVEGEIFDVAVDVRVGSPSFAEWVGATLNESNHHQLWVPPGFAHGFLVLSETALVTYKCTAFYDAPSEIGVRWDDPTIAIEWPLQQTTPTLSSKDAAANFLEDIDAQTLPTWTRLNAQ